MKINTHASATAFRIKQFRYAVATSLLSKVITLAVQVIALPIAAISLGVHGFSLYALLTAAVGWLTLSNLGIGPILVVKLAATHVHGDFKEESHIFSSAFFITLIVSALVSFFAILAVWLLPVQNIFGPLYVSDLLTIKWGLTVLTVLFFLQSNISLFESAQAGYQQQYVQNLIAVVSGLPCLLAVWIVSQNNPTPVSLILALNMPLVIMRFVNVGLIVFRQPHIFPSLNSFRWSICKNLVQNGITFSLAGGLGNFLAHILPVILVGRSFSADVSASFAVTMNAIILASGVIGMLLRPLWPAVADSVARGDREWAKIAYKRLLKSVMAFGFFVALFLIVYGEWMFRIWFHGKINPSYWLIVSAGFYFVVLCWESLHFSIMVGLHKVSIASILMCARSILGVSATIMLLDKGSEALPFMMMIISIAVVNLIPMRKLVLRGLDG
jgi:O-antigen/teichoic acid export membrane protein